MKKAIRNVINRMFLSACILYFGHPSSGSAANSFITVGSDFYTPTNATINVNDQVVWTWTNTFNISHSTTSDTGLWDSGQHAASASSRFSFTNKFTSAGRFTFHCTVHPTNMLGTIVVLSANLPPIVSITNLTNGEIFSAPASFTLTATASDSDGSVTNVEFLNGTSPIINLTISPYSTPQNNLSAGDYTFSAIATDNGGLTATNGVLIHVVTPEPIVLGTLQIAPPTSFQFTYSANAGLSYVVQQSSDLSAWTALNTNVAAGSTVTFTDTNAVANPGFYRVGLVPNP